MYDTSRLTYGAGSLLATETRSWKRNHVGAATQLGARQELNTDEPLSD